jgi:hypothetical protein
MTAFAAHFRREPYLSKGGRVPARSRAPAKLKKGSDGGARQGALRQALHGDWCAPRPPSDSGIGKARDRFPGAGSILNFRDDEDMPVICPTGQVFFCLRGLDASDTSQRLVQIRL